MHMNMPLFTMTSALLVAMTAASARGDFEKDTVVTSSGNLEITFIGHGSLMMRFAGKTIYIDPWGQLADYSLLPKADLILVTHDHRDHWDLKAIEQVRTDKTVVLLTGKCAAAFSAGVAMKNGDSRVVLGIRIDAVPAYNIVHKRPEGNVFHPKGEGNGYILTFGATRVYIAGDTENTPEMKALRNIAVAFLPMNLPYTMTPEMVADAARAFKPKVLYPYHYGETDPAKLVELLKGEKGIEVRVRRMK
jgi:L-ascorbate metabolism protein UlaG (beta-lactamase superfamily)